MFFGGRLNFLQQQDTQQKSNKLRDEFIKKVENTSMPDIVKKQAIRQFDIQQGAIKPNLFDKLNATSSSIFSAEGLKGMGKELASIPAAVGLIPEIGGRKLASESYKMLKGGKLTPEEERILLEKEAAPTLYEKITNKNLEEKAAAREAILKAAAAPTMAYGAGAETWGGVALRESAQAVPFGLASEFGKEKPSIGGALGEIGTQFGTGMAFAGAGKLLKAGAEKGTEVAGTMTKQYKALPQAVKEGGYVQIPGGKQAAEQVTKKVSKTTSNVVLPEEAATVFDNVRATQPVTTTVKEKVARKFDVMYGYDKGEEAKNIYREINAKTSLAQEAASKSSMARERAFSKMSPGEQLGFIYSVQTNQVPKGSEKIAGFYTKAFADDADIIKKLSPDTPIMDNYFTQLGILGKDAPQAIENIKTTFGGGKGFLKQRKFADVLELAKYQVEHPDLDIIKETNPEKLFINYHAAVQKAKMADDFYKVAGKENIPKETRNALITRVMDKGLETNKIYQGIREVNADINAYNFSLSGFHAIFTTLGDVVNTTGLAIKEGTEVIKKPSMIVESGKHLVEAAVSPIIDVTKGIQVRKAVREAIKQGATTYDAIINTIPDPVIKRDVMLVVKSGGGFNMDPIYRSKAVKRFWDGLAKGGIKGYAETGINAPLALLSKLSQPIMGMLVPNLKVGAFLKMAESEIKRLGPKAANNIVARKAISKSWNSVDNVFGELIKDNLFWNKALEDLTYSATRSAGWTIGSVKHVGGGLLDIANIPKTIRGIASGEGISDKAAFTLALPVVVGLGGAIYQKLLTGENPKEIIDYFHPKNGLVDSNGIAQRDSFPSYLKDVGGMLRNPGGTIKAKQSPFWGTVAELATNENYWGDLIRNPNASALEQAKQLGTHIAGKFLPFSFQQYQRISEEEAPTWRKAVAATGLITQAPKSVSETTFQKKVYNLLDQQTGELSRTPEQQKVNKLKKQARKELQATGKSDTLKQLIESGNVKNKKDFKKTAKLDSLQRAFDSLSYENQQKALEFASEEDKAKMKKLMHKKPGTSSGGSLFGGSSGRLNFLKGY